MQRILWTVAALPCASRAAFTVAAKRCSGTILPTIFLLAGWLMLPMASAAQTHAHSAMATAPAISAPGSRQTDAKPPWCNTLDLRYFRYFPGLVAGCYAERKWMKGHYHSAISDFESAASWGSKPAQYSLGLIYYDGRHVKADKSLGIAWLELAAERHDPLYEMVARSAKKLATPQQRRGARELLSHMRLRYADAVAAKRAWTQYQHRRRYVAMQQMISVGHACQTLPSPSANAMSNGAIQPQCFHREVGENQFKDRLSALASYVFEGWQGTARVGPLQEVPVPAASSGN